MSNDFSPISLQHVNLVVDKGSLELAEEFYGEVLGFKSDPVPQLQRDSLRWLVGQQQGLRHALTADRFRIGDGPQQVSFCAAC